MAISTQPWLFRTALDSDASAYIATASIVDGIEILRIHRWFIGLKALGVYDLITEMWSLRDFHNPLTTIYGMKGVGNCSRFGTITQDSSGISNDGVDAAGILSSTVQVMPNSPDFSVIEVGCVLTGAGTGYGAGYGAGWNAGVGIMQSSTSYVAIGNDYNSALLYNYGGLVPLDNQQFRVLSITGERAGNTILNGATSALIDPSGGVDYSTWGKSATGYLLYSGISAGGYSKQNRSFVALASTNISDFEPQIRTLYKSTIGAGLGLP